MQVIQLVTQKPKLPDDVPGILRRIADAVEAGEVTQLLLATLQNDEFDVFMPSSISESVVLSALIQRRTTDKLFES